MIISELESIYVKIINSNSHDKSDYYFNRINFITLIFDRNVNGIYLYHDGNGYRRGKAFESYKNLYFIINLVNEYYDELVKKGFKSPIVWYQTVWSPFLEVVEKNLMSEEEKIKAFLGLVNGTMKFHPVYKYEVVGYVIKPIEYDKTIGYDKKWHYEQLEELPNTSVELPQTDTIFAIEGEGANQKLVKKPNIKEEYITLKWYF